MNAERWSLIETYRGWDIVQVEGGFHVALDGNSSADSGPPFSTVEDAKGEIDRCEDETSP